MVGAAGTRRPPGARLAIDGGTPVRTGPPPPRRAFAEAERDMVNRVFQDAWDRGIDFSVQGRFEAEFCDRFAAYHGGGWADAVNAGSTAIYVGLSALGLPKGADVIVSPVTNAADAMAVALLDLRPVVCDAAPGGFNVDAESVRQALTPDTAALLLTHAGGFPVAMEPIVAMAEANGIKVVEDTSQAHGARIGGRLAGTFGDMLVASTGFSKTLATGGSGGVVLTGDEATYWKVRAHADRGKPFERPDFDQKLPGMFQFPALNHNLDELSAAIGLSLLDRLDDINRRRLAVWTRIRDGLAGSAGFVLCPPPEGADPAFFYAPVRLREEAWPVTKDAVTEALQAEGIWLNPHYRELVAEWPWYRRLTNKAYTTPNAAEFRDRSFNLLFHEGFADSDADAVVEALLKVERAYTP